MVHLHDREVPSQLGRRDTGFSLLEVMITLAILSGIAVSSLLVAVPISRQSRINREIQIANCSVQKVLETLEGQPLNTLATKYPQGSTYPIAELENGWVRVTYDDPAADPLQIQAVLSWISPDLGPMNRSFRTARTR